MYDGCEQRLIESNFLKLLCVICLCFSIYPTLLHHASVTGCRKLSCNRLSYIYLAPPNIFSVIFDTFISQRIGPKTLSVTLSWQSAHLVNTGSAQLERYSSKRAACAHGSGSHSSQSWALPNQFNGDF